MAAARKFEGLPDVDASAPDVYETTPDLTADTSTLQDASIQSPSDVSEDDDNNNEQMIDRRRYKANQARSKFQPSRVNADNVDFSDRLNFNQRSYRTATSRRHPGRHDYDAEELGHLSDEDDDEPLDRKLARLRREVEQVRLAIAEENESDISGDEIDDERINDIQRISQSLNEINTTRRGRANGAEHDLQQKLKTFSRLGIKDSAPSTDTAARTTKARSISKSSDINQSLAKTAEVDQRLHFLEKAMGLKASTSISPSDDSNRLVLPTIESLEQTIGLAMAQPAQLDAAQAKSQKLLEDLERFSKLRADAENSKTTSSVNGVTNGVPEDDVSEQVSKINALYGLLPTIDTLAPSLPLVLDRLRSLRLLHGSAADAQTLLQDVERRQNEQEQELQQWREALDQVEKLVVDSEKGLADNMKQMGDWIRKLEERTNQQ